MTTAMAAKVSLTLQVWGMDLGLLLAAGESLPRMLTKSGPYSKSRPEDRDLLGVGLGFMPSLDGSRWEVPEGVTGDLCTLKGLGVYAKNFARACINLYFLTLFSLSPHNIILKTRVMHCF
jgi:hypothetical protein